MNRINAERLGRNLKKCRRDISLIHMLKSEIPDAYLTVGKNSMPIIGSTVLSLFSQGKLPSDENLREAVEKAAHKYTLHTDDFEHISWCAMYCACFSDLSDKDCDTLFYAVKAIDFTEISSANPVEKLYINDPAGVYSLCSEETRRAFRAMTAEIAQASGESEAETAQRMLGRAQSKNGHVGKFISDEYAGLFRGLTHSEYVKLLAFTPLFISIIIGIAVGSLWLCLALYLPLWEVMRCFIDRFIMASSRKRIFLLPSLDYSDGIPKEAKTAVVISVMLPDSSAIDKLEERLLSLAISCGEENVKICALCDLSEAPLPEIAGDEAILTRASEMTERLNKDLDGRIILIIRHREFSETQGKYIGYERKRGAIEQLTRLSRGENIPLRLAVGDIDFLRSAVFFAALDFDTRPLLDSIRKLVASAMHPMNRPVIEDGKVTDGYGIIVPDVTLGCRASRTTPFAKHFGGEVFSGTYDVRSANLYMDSFGTSTFGGKGLIDVDSFYHLCCGNFPSGKILSHDILEGALLRTAFAGDIRFTENFPPRTDAYFARLHRWIRGDAQNFPYIFGKLGIPKFDRFRLFDNIRRAVTPILVFRLLLLGWFMSEPTVFLAVFAAFLTILTPNIIAAAEALRRIFSDFRGSIKEAGIQIIRGLYAFVLLPQQAVISLDALIRGFWRLFVSKKNLLSWTASSVYEKRSGKAFRRILKYIPSELLSLLLILSPYPLVRLVGIIFAFQPFFALSGDRNYRSAKHSLSTDESAQLFSEVAAMWNFYEDYALRKDNYLPPDNVQFAPVARTAHRTSPTNIGLFLISILAARDLELIDSNGLYIRLRRTIASIEKLETYEGNLYNWYDTKSLKKLEPAFVSSVDCGNFLCCLIVVREGAGEYLNSEPKLVEIIDRVDELIKSARLDVFYNKKRNLFSIGINAKSGKLHESCYDLLMSEARMLSYFAVARGDVPKKHWSALSRVIVRDGKYIGSLSYFGTMFEYFMPQLLLESIPGGLIDASLKYCVHCQRKYAASRGFPFGISESAYNGFDGALNYQYRAHGAKGTGLRIASPDSYVVSPYSSYLCIGTAYGAVRRNLAKLAELGAYGKYGYFEAVEFDSKKHVLIKSYMAHHVGMSIISVHNLMSDNIICKRFMNNITMGRAAELLEEGIFSVSGRNAQKNYKSSRQKEEKNMELFYHSDTFSPSAPRIKLLSNGEYTAAVTNLGTVTALYRGETVYRRTYDNLRRPYGCFFAIGEKGDSEPITYLPSYNAEGKSVEFSEREVNFKYETDGIMAEMSISLHNTLPCEMRQFKLKNLTKTDKTLRLSAFIEPVMCREEDFSSHPAYSKLFLSLEYDRENSLIYVSRRGKGFSAVMGYVSSAPMRCNFSREDILDYPKGVESAFCNISDLPESRDYIPDPAIFADVEIPIPAGAEEKLCFFICAASEKKEAMASAAKLRAQKLTMANSPLKSFSAHERVTCALLPSILTLRSRSRKISEAVLDNKMKVNDLWRFSVSGDFPIILLEIFPQGDEERISVYISVFRTLEMCLLPAELVILYSERTDTSDENRVRIESIIRKICGDIRPTIHLINKDRCSDEDINLIRAAAVYEAPKNLVMPEVPETTPVLAGIEGVSPPNGLKSGFYDGFYQNVGHLRRAHSLILASPVFGTLLSESSLGFTFAKNSRLNMLTPWENDCPNRGELLLLRCNGHIYNLILGSACEFHEDKAVYIGETDNFSSRVTVAVSDKGFCKKINVKIAWKSAPNSADICYYTEPVMCADIKKSPKTRMWERDGALLCDNLYGFEYGGVMAISSDKKLIFTDCSEDIMSGKFRKSSGNPEVYPCASGYTELDFVEECSEINFFLTYGQNEDSALKMPQLFSSSKLPPAIKISVPNSSVGDLCSTLLCNQIVKGRICGRTGQYQNSGAWGFRDQLQDACACASFMPELTRKIIINSCSAQFEEGDVLHWWHRMPRFVLRGVRTRCSDDLLWLPYAVCEYIRVTGRKDILRIEVGFSKSAPLSSNESDRYEAVGRSEKKASVYEHCRRAIDYAYKTGERGLILIGSGDWNDSFSKLGIEGKGESVWLTQFMAMVLDMMCKIATESDAIIWKKRRKKLLDAIENHCWDGQWYRRAYGDDGQILGTYKNEECRIDSISQSFACFCKMPNMEKVKIALRSAAQELFDRRNGIIKLFTPPITDDSIGYVGKYPPGIRENGGQYTHAAIWLCMAMFRIGDIGTGLEMLEALNVASKGKSLQFGNEPYYMTADIYTNPQCYGRGGWSLYTGASGWFLRLVINELIGLKRSGGMITIDPKVPMKCNVFLCGTEIEILAEYSDFAECEVDGKVGNEIPDDGDKHFVRIGIKLTDEQDLD